MSSPVIQEDFQQRQDDELLSITSIYPNEVSDLRQNKAWKNWKPLELLIHLSPSVSISGVVSTTTKADLYIRCSQDYPNSIPFIDIQNVKGLSVNDVSKLKSELRNVAQNYIGREMLFELIDHSRNYLNEHKKPHYESFHHEMMHNKQQLEKELVEKQEREKEALKRVEETKLLAIEAERNKKLEALKDANRKSRLPESFAKPDRVRPRSLSESSCKDVCSGTVRTTLKFSGRRDELSIFCGKCLNHNKRGCVVYYGMDTTSGDPVTVVKWVFQWSMPAKPKNDELEAIKIEQESYMKQLAIVEQEFKALRQLKHDNIGLYLGVNYVQKKDRLIVYILQEYISGCSLSLMCNGVPLSIQQLQSHVCKILHAIQYLHEKSIVHRNIRDTSIFICNDGQVKVLDYALDKRLYDLYRSLTEEPEIDLYPPTVGKGGKKGDIYRLGVIVLYLCTGQLQRDSPPKIPQSLNPCLKDFLEKCLLHDEQERWSADQLLSHSFTAFSSLHNIMPSKFEESVHLKEANNKLMESAVPVLNSEYSHDSRLLIEFEIMQCLGKGGFGHVYKVRNKLDSSIYALKKISLNTTSKQLDKKIKREVKVLSRLNHENIVRYFNSWIEETLKNDEYGNNVSDIFGLNEDCEQTTANSSVQWEMHNTKDEDTSDDDDVDDFDVSLCLPRTELSHSNSIIFEKGDCVDISVSIDEDSTIANRKESLTMLDKPKVERFMYIQMEFCERSTLRTAIDNGLYKDIPRIWRLFREIVEGLVHIHQQGVIHRDLKPMNIFLDSNEHVKIGDFGLATDVISKSINFEILPPVDTNLDIIFQSLEANEDGSRTGNIGTTLYAAPETTSKAKVIYSQKVDIYSLGIIFFEMCYPPPLTIMERNKLIYNLRHPDIMIPLESDEQLSPEMIHLVKWLLQHDVSKRPTSAELSNSEYIPPPLIEETELHNILRNTVANPQNRSYKYMMNCLFGQETPAEFDFTYDTEVSKGMSTRTKLTQVFCDVMEVLNRVLRRHGAVYYSVPTLMPKSSVYNNDTCVYMVDHSGGILNLPHDLRVPFARHVARKDILQLKRFALEKVYREEKVFGFHPREQYEYAFDFVTPTQYSLMPDAEVIAVISEIISEFSSLEKRDYFIYLNHVSIIKSLIKFCDISESEESIIYRVFDNQKNRNATKLQLQHMLIDNDLSEDKALKFVQFFEVSDIDKISSVLHPLIHKKGDVSTMVKKGIKDLRTVVDFAESFGVKLQLFVCPCLIHEIKIYSGVIFQFVCDLKLKKKRPTLDILAAGGRYDKLIHLFQFKTLTDCGKSHNQTAVGASIAIEKIFTAETETNGSEEVNFVVFSSPEMKKEVCSLLKDIWSFGFSAVTFYDKQLSLDDVVVYCQNNDISHLLIINQWDQGVIKVRSFEKEKINERKLCTAQELRDYLSKLKVSSKSTNENSQPMKTEFQRSHSVASTVLVNVRFLFQEKVHGIRKREPHIRSHVMSVLQPMSNRVWEIIALDLKMTVIGSVVSACDINANEESIHQAFSTIIDMHSRYKYELLELCNQVCDIKSKKNSIVILYSLSDSNFRVLL